MIKLGVNIDHVATLRNARGECYPSPVEFAKKAIIAGADSIVFHLREDRRHILDADAKLLKQTIKVPLNMEMAPSNEMIGIALDIRPNFVCLVPENRQEITTEGGLDVDLLKTELQSKISKLQNAGISVTLFIDAQQRQVEASHQLKANNIEINTGAYCSSVDKKSQNKELENIKIMAAYAKKLDLEVHVGHGLNYQNIHPILKVPQITEFNIGHFLISESVFFGLNKTIKKMKNHVNGIQ